MKRLNVESGINVIINDSGNVPAKGFEVVKVRTPQTLQDALRIFKKLYDNWDCVYMYQVNTGFRVEFKTYTKNLNDAISIRNQVEEVLEGLEDER